MDGCFEDAGLVILRVNVRTGFCACRRDWAGIGPLRRCNSVMMKGLKLCSLNRGSVTLRNSVMADTIVDALNVCADQTGRRAQVLGADLIAP